LQRLKIQEQDLDRKLQDLRWSFVTTSRHP
jgi:hypothetical protein